MATATHTKEITMQKAPSIIQSVADMRYHGILNCYGHGYCTAQYSEGRSAITTYDVYCQNDGETYRIGRNITSHEAIVLINRANTATFNGEEVAA